MAVSVQLDPNDVVQALAVQRNRFADEAANATAACEKLSRENEELRKKIAELAQAAEKPEEQP